MLPLPVSVGICTCTQISLLMDHYSNIIHVENIHWTGQWVNIWCQQGDRQNECTMSVQLYKTSWF